MNQLVLMAAMVVAAAFGATGQIMLNKGSQILKISPIGILSNPYLYAFAFFYGMGVIINLGAYKLGGRVSIIYPVISLSYIFASFLAWKFLGETINGWTWLGTVIIVAGVGLIGYGATQ